MKKATILALAICASVAAVSPVSATVVDWSLVKFRNYLQTENNALPATPTSFEIFSQLAVDNPGDFSSVALGGVAGGPMPFHTEDGGFDWELEENFPDQAALDAAMSGPMNVTIDATIAGLGTIREPIEGLGDFPELRPVFTGAVYEALQSYNPAEEITLAWNDPSLSQENLNEVFLYIDEVTPSGSQEVFYADGLTSTTSLVVPANTVEAGKNYVVVLAFAKSRRGARESFAAGEEIVAEGNQVGVEFSPVLVPEPATFGLLGIVATAMLPWRRLRRLA
ncbi:MAG: PEP-CTERM sorting domain-containing protein [Planctomycetota bacterium]